MPGRVAIRPTKRRPFTWRPGPSGASVQLLPRPEATPVVLAKPDLPDLTARLADMLEEVYENQITRALRCDLVRVRGSPAPS